MISIRPHLDDIIAEKYLGTKIIVINTTGYNPIHNGNNKTVTNDAETNM